MSTWSRRHGTGTVLGDPIEAQALLATYGRDRDPQRPLLARLDQVEHRPHPGRRWRGRRDQDGAWRMRHGVLPGTLHVDAPVVAGGLVLGGGAAADRAAAWPARGRPRRAGVSSFGISGTNAHVIVEEAPPRPEPPSRGDGTATPVPAVPWVLTARSAAALRARAAAVHSEQPHGHGPGGDRRPGRADDVAWSLAATRTAFEHRAVIVGRIGPHYWPGWPAGPGTTRAPGW